MLESMIKEIFFTADLIQVVLDNVLTRMPPNCYILCECLWWKECKGWKKSEKLWLGSLECV